MRRATELFALALVLLALPAAAADNGFYIGGSIGQAEIATGDLDQDIEVDGDELGSYKVFAGFRFLTFGGVEAAYADFGEITDDANASTAEVDGISAAAVLYIPFGIGDVFAKGGVFDWNADLSTVTERRSLDGTDPFYGAGIQFRIKSWAIRGEVEYIDAENTDSVYMYSIGASWTF